MSKFFSRFVRQETISTAIEFGLLTALVAIVSLSAVTALGIKMSRSSEVEAVASAR